jgi:small conductance mechanosensitive channel
MEAVVDKVYEYLLLYGINIVAALVIFILGRWLARAISNVIARMLRRSNVDEMLTGFIKNITYFGLLLVVIVATLNKLGLQTTSLIAVLGAAGLAIGLALQGSLANFAAGIMLIIFKPFKVGDFIEAAGTTGIVKEVHIFNTILHTLDNRKVIVPNAKLTGDNITNFTGLEKRRVDLVFGISYTDNIKTAKDALEHVVTSDSRILKDPRPSIAVSALADSSVNLICRPWVKPDDYWDVYFDTIENGKLEMEKRGITIPFPQRDVHLYEEKNPES